MRAGEEVAGGYFLKACSVILMNSSVWDPVVDSENVFSHII